MDTTPIQIGDLSYEQAFEELREISLSIENDSISLDALAIKVGRAAELIKLCQLKLRSAESDVNEIIHEMKKEE